MITEPDIQFSDWKQWDESCRQLLTQRALPYSLELEWPGIYVWAWAEKTPTAEKMDIRNPPESVIYVGEAKGSLRRRIRQFDKSYFCQSSGHDGGQRCRLITSPQKGALYLAYFSLNTVPVEFWQDRHHWSRPFLHHVERTLIWNYVRLWHRRPDGNRT